jgi:hypothetical protein
VVKKIIAIVTTACILFSLLSVNFMSNAVYYGSEALNGDADGNGVVDLDDVLIVLQVASDIKRQSSVPYIENADIDNDGLITISDARQILQHTAGLVNLQPSGAFIGFESNSDSIDEEEAIETFNYYLNAIKNPETEKLNAGFTKTETQALYLEDGLKIGGVEFIGINLGGSVGAITDMVLEKLTESDADRVEDVIAKGESCYNDISVEGQTYVSQLTADDVCGIKFNLDQSTMVATIEVALYDSVMENASTTGYGKVLDTERMIASSTGTLAKIIDYGTQAPVMTREFRNCVLKVEILLDQVTGGRVISYTVSYDEYAFIYEAITSVGRLSTGKTKIKDTEMKRYHIIEYTNFQW